MPKNRSKVRVLLIAEAANPDLTSGALVGWLHSRAVAEVCDSHLVTELRNADSIKKAGLADDQYTAIDSRFAQGMAWKMASLLRRGKEYNWSIYTALSTLAYPIFERKVWKRFKRELKAGEFDVVHRVTPVTPVAPSPLAKRCAKLGIPFVLGPLNGGVPWPPGFSEMRRRDRDWLGRFRGLYRFMPWYKSTRSCASAIVVASHITKEQIDERYYPKCVYVPENSVDVSRFSLREDTSGVPGKVRVCFVGRLVALKGVDMLVEACEELIRKGEVELDIIGDGPERGRLEQMAEERGIKEDVHFPGWVEHGQLQDRLMLSPVFAFPSIREFGGGAVLEAMAMGMTPVVLGYGGPLELVPEGTGVVVKLGTRAEVVDGFRKAIEELVSDPARCRKLGEHARAHVARVFTWEAKAQQMLEIYQWVTGVSEERPDFGMPFPFESS